MLIFVNGKKNFIISAAAVASWRGVITLFGSYWLDRELRAFSPQIN